LKKIISLRRSKRDADNGARRELVVVATKLAVDIHPAASNDASVAVTAAH
jgi:hypothetical protein